MKSLMSLVLGSVMVFAVTACHAEEKAAKKDAPQPINKKCPVEGGDVDPETAIQHDGKTIGFCCAGCDEEFKKDPAKYMAIIAKEQAAAPAKDGKKDGADKKEKKLNAKCPVSGDDADPSITKEYKGRTIAFCCEDCVKDFDKDPAKYIKKLDEMEKEQKKDEKKK
jgi:YHS domain-containing protein